MIALPAQSFTVLFLSLLALMLLAQIGLARRHIRHVSACRASVPSAFREKISLAAHQKAADYTVAKSRFGLVEALFSAVLLVLWTVGGGLELVDNVWQSLDLPPLFTGAAFIFTVLFVSGLLELPLSIYHTFVTEAHFGFNKITPRLFIGDLIKKILISLALGIPLVLAVLWLMQKMGSWWWLYVWLLWTAFSLIMLWAYPAVIAPLFNQFKPLTQESLLQRIQALLDRTGFKNRGVFVMDGSRRSAHGNAYFTGIGRNKRIVFFDTLIRSLSESEIEAVLAHELGHFKRRHVLKRALLIFSGSFLGLALLGWLMGQSWFYVGLGLTRPSTYGALVLFLLVSPVFTFFLHPLFAWGSRRHEYEADAFAAKQAEATTLISALVKLYEENASTLTPDPWHSAFYDSHPPAAARIAHLQALA